MERICISFFHLKYFLQLWDCFHGNVQWGDSCDQKVQRFPSIKRHRSTRLLQFQKWIYCFLQRNLLLVEWTCFGVLPIWLCRELVQEGEVDRWTQSAHLLWLCERDAGVPFSTLRENDNPCPHSSFIQTTSSTVIWSQTTCSLYPFLRKEKMWGQNCRISERQKIHWSKPPPWVRQEHLCSWHQKYRNKDLFYFISDSRRRKIWQQMRCLFIWDDGMVDKCRRIPLFWIKKYCYAFKKGLKRRTTTA